MITHEPKTQKDVDEWISFGTTVLSRKLRRDRTDIDPAEVLSSMYEVSRAYVGDGSDFKRFVWSTLVRRWSRLHPPHLIRHHVFLSEHPWRVEYMRYRKCFDTDVFDANDCRQFIINRYNYRVDTRTLEFHWRNNFTSDMSLAQSAQDFTMRHNYNLVEIVEALDLYKSIYGDTLGTMFVESFLGVREFDTVLHFPATARPPTQQVLSFLYHQLNPKTYNEFVHHILGA